MKKKAFFAGLLLSFVGAIAAVPATASTVLYDNSTASSYTINAYSINGGYSTTNSFTLTAAATINEITAGIWLIDPDTLTSIGWEVDSGVFSGTVFASGTASSFSTTFISQLCPQGYGYCLDIYSDKFFIPALTLAAGTYYLEFENATSIMGDQGAVFWDESNGTSTAYQTSSYYGTLPASSETFQLVNAPVPEPSSIMLLGSGLAGLAGMIRRKLKY